MPIRNVYFALIVVLVSLFVASKTSLKEQIFRGAARELERRALDAPSRDALLEGAAAGMAQAVGDAPYTAYLPPAEKGEYLNEIQGKFTGIGVRNLLKDEESGEFYFTPMRSTPASNAGLKLGDRIVAVDGRDVCEFSLDDLTAALRGPENSTVRLKIRPRATIPAFAQTDAADKTDVFREVEITRATVRQDVVSGDRVDANGDWIYTLSDYPQIGYVAVEQFADDTATETLAALDKLEAAGISSVILDFRGNPGGFLPDAIRISDEFVPADAKIVETRGRDGEIETVYRATNKKKRSFRVVVLVDGDSASASEIVSAALQDAGVAVVGGERSYGKGTIQSYFELPCDLGLLRMTTAGFWRPSGKPIHRRRDATDSDVWGVSPNPELALSPSERDDFFRAWTRSLRVSEPENGELDAQTLAFIKNETQTLFRLIDERSKRLAQLAALAGSNGATPENPDADAPAHPESSANADASQPFEPSGRAPRFDPQLDRAVDYLTGALPVGENSETEAETPSAKNP